MREGVVVQCWCCGCYIAAKEAIEAHGEWYCVRCDRGECDCDEPEAEGW